MVCMVYTPKICMYKYRSYVYILMICIHVYTYIYAYITYMTRFQIKNVIMVKLQWEIGQINQPKTRPRLLEETYHTLLPDDRHPVLHAVHSIGDLGEVVLAQCLLAQTEGAVVCPCYTQVITREETGRNGPHLLSAFLTCGHSAASYPVLPVHPFIHTFIHGQWCKPCKTTASWSGAVRVRRLAQVHLNTVRRGRGLNQQPSDGQTTRSTRMSDWYNI